MKTSKIRLLLLLCLFIFPVKIMASDHDSRKLGLYAEMLFSSKSIWHGWDINNKKPVYHPYIGIDLWQTGLQLGAWASVPVDRSLDVNDDFEFLLKYGDVKLKDNRFEFDFHGFVDYIIVPNVTDFPQIPSASSTAGTKQLWKMNLGIAFNKLIPVGDSYIVPMVNLYYFSPVAYGDMLKGTVFEYTLSYSRHLAKKLSFTANLNAIYHDRLFGVNEWGAYSLHTFYNYAITDKLTGKAFLHVQKSVSDDVNPDDVFWGGFGLAYSF